MLKAYAIIHEVATPEELKIIALEAIREGQKWRGNEQQGPLRSSTFFNHSAVKSQAGPRTAYINEPQMVENRPKQPTHATPYSGNTNDHNSVSVVGKPLLCHFALRKH